MSKEIQYQKEAQSFIEKQWESYNGTALSIYTEEFSKEHNDVLQESSPLIGGNVGSYAQLKSKFGIVGLREKLIELNKERVELFLNKNKRKESLDLVLESLFQDFKDKYNKCSCEAELFQLIFTPEHELKGKLKREVYLPNCKEPLTYNAIYYEQPNNYLGKNAFYIIRERRIPVLYHQHKQTERPDFCVYINGIPLVIIEYKTEDSGILQSLKDFEYKESYRKAPFKIALNDGRNVLFFADLKALKFKSGKNNSFEWVHYLPEKKHLGPREFTNIEYLFDELICQPQNLYNYCMDGCSVVTNDSNYYLINARIQQYYALKDINKTLLSASNKTLSLPYNFEFAHAQRSGKTITMKLLSYMIAKNFKDVFKTIFIYTPDLQIKQVLSNEFGKEGTTKAIVKVINTRAEYFNAVKELHDEETTGVINPSFRIYIVNMQKITDNDTLVSMTVKNTNVLNIIDEAHHGQAKKIAMNRDKIFPSASNYLFTATGKSEMYAYYFPDNDATGFRSKFTISDAKLCKITVPVAFLRAEKTFQLTNKLREFSLEIERRLENQFDTEALIHGVLDADSEGALGFGNKKVSKQIKRMLNWETIEEKIKYVATFLDSVKEGLPFSPKAIMYVDSIEMAKTYVSIIQKQAPDNIFLGYHWGVDFSSLNDVSCSLFNPGIKEPKDVSSMFEKIRNSADDKQVIDILFAVDKYQKGFDLAPLIVTFLDTNINEPARMNQIYTRTATKLEGKTTGYCVDLTLDNNNPDTFQQSLLMYDNNENKDSFIDDEFLEDLKAALAKQFKDLRESLNLTLDNFTSSMILQQILNEQDLVIREKRQYAFFFTTKNIIKNLNKIGSPLYFKPFMVELKALYEAFNNFKEIYAEKSHPEHHKILINTDISMEDGYFITDQEIKDVINQTLAFFKENNIKSLLQFDYTNKHTEISTQGASQELIKKISQELSKDNVEKGFKELQDYLIQNHFDLFENIKSMLERISENRNLIYEEMTQVKIKEIELELGKAREIINFKINSDFNGNKFLFWGNEVGNTILKENEIIEPRFVSFMISEIYAKMKIILPQIEDDLSKFAKTQVAIDMFREKVDATTFSFYMSDYFSKEVDKSSFIKQLSNAPKSGEGLLFSMRKDLFEKMLSQTLRQYYS